MKYELYSRDEALFSPKRHNFNREIVFRHFDCSCYVDRDNTHQHGLYMGETRHDIHGKKRNYLFVNVTKAGNYITLFDDTVNKMLNYIGTHNIFTVIFIYFGEDDVNPLKAMSSQCFKDSIRPSKFSNNEHYLLPSTTECVALRPFDNNLLNY